MTREQVVSLSPCSLSKIPDFGRKKYFTPKDAFDAGVSTSDFMWLLGKTGHKWVAVKMALLYAQNVSDLNSDPRVREAIDAGWRCVENPSDAAAYAAYAASRAASAADAAYAAASAAYAAYAADAADAAAYAAASAASADTAKLNWIDVFNQAISASYEIRHR